MARFLTTGLLMATTATGQKAAPVADPSKGKVQSDPVKPGTDWTTLWSVLWRVALHTYGLAPKPPRAIAYKLDPANKIIKILYHKISMNQGKIPAAILNHNNLMVKAEVTPIKTLGSSLKIYIYCKDWPYTVFGDLS